jgi:Flp pilus assembly protein TadG
MVAALLFLLLFGIVEFARFVAVSSAVETASREAARYGSAVGTSGSGVPRYADCDEIRAAGVRLSGFAALASTDIEVSYDAGPGTGVVATCPSGSIDPAAIAAGDRIVVTSTTTFESVMPFLDDVTVEATERRTIFKP